MDKVTEKLNKIVVKSFENIISYDCMVEALRCVIYAQETPKEFKRELLAELLRSLVVSAPEQLDYNGVELAQLLEKMLQTVSINTWTLQQFCDECQTRRATCEACINGTKTYKNVPETSVANFTVKGKPVRTFSPGTSQPTSVEFSWEADKNLNSLSALFESHFPEISFETKAWLRSSWRSLKEQYDMDRKDGIKPRTRPQLIESLRKSNEVHFLSVLLFDQKRCLNCGEARSNDRKKYYCSVECDKDFSQFFTDWTSKKKYKGRLDDVTLTHLKAVLEKKRGRQSGGRDK